MNARLPLLPFLLLAAPAAGQELGERTRAPETMIPALAPGQDDLAEAIAVAGGHPLGSLENPVRVGGPAGERAYLARLRCSDGAVPRAAALSESEVGGFGSVVHAWRLDCGDQSHRIRFDRYHEEHVEERAPPGLGIVPR